MNGSLSRYAFLSFLDLVSCAFGAAVLIFLVTLVAGTAGGSGTPPDALLIYAEHSSGDSPEIDFMIKQDALNWTYVSNQGRMAMDESGWLPFSPPAGCRGSSYLIIPRPKSGRWEVGVYRTNGALNTDAVFRVQCFGARIKGDAAPTKLLTIKHKGGQVGISDSMSVWVE